MLKARVSETLSSGVDVASRPCTSLAPTVNERQRNLLQKEKRQADLGGIDEVRQRSLGLLPASSLETTVGLRVVRQIYRQMDDQRHTLMKSSSAGMVLSIAAIRS